MKVSGTRALVESAILIAIGTMLSVIKIAELPYGGSVTVASMLPIVIISYRHGIGRGLVSGLIFGVIQQLLGLNTLSYVSTWQSILAVILLDYIVAFLVLGFGGVFRRAFKDQAPALVCGSLLVCLLRYACHVISGATVWAGLSIPTADALIYSFAYNATYMIPETVVLLIAAYYLGSTLDFRSDQPVRLARKEKSAVSVFGVLAGLILAAGVIFDVAAVFSKLQNAETGNWDIAGLHEVNWPLVICVTAAALTFFMILLWISKLVSKSNTKNIGIAGGAVSLAVGTLLIVFSRNQQQSTEYMLLKNLGETKEYIFIDIALYLGIIILVCGAVLILSCILNKNRSNETGKTTESASES
ncbi:MAG: energy-coupled thiamine transporter ThiT [Clostridia bacterium]|nr:energy-coupled thiamine transporter ThiT [Clostridia bacterium]